MEQKQLDEEDTFFGEEFIEEEVKTEIIDAEETKPGVVVEEVDKKKTSKKVKAKTVSKKEAKVDEPIKEEIKIIPANEPVAATAPVTETSVPTDPWDDDDDENSGGSSVWKLITGVLLILLIASVFTNGFGISNDDTAQLSLSEAEEKALNYVNSNLLQAPFVAEVESSEDVGTLFKVSLSVEGQTVESYLTKDGNLFFPQGFETGGSLTTETGLAGSVEVSLDDDAVKGDANAPVTIVEFSDYECPFCGKFVRETYPSIVSEYIDTGKVKYVFRDFPLDFHLNAQKASEAAECAGEQGKYWEMHDYLFANQDYLAVEYLKAYAKDLQLDLEDFNDCLDSGKFADEVLADLADGQAYGVSGTPAFFINGKLLSGAQPFAVFKAEIDAALASAGEVQVVEVAEEVDLEEVIVEEESADLDLPVEDEVEVVEEPVPVVEETQPLAVTKTFSVAAKKWMFAPNKIVVNKGDFVKLSIIPQSLDFTFALPGFSVEQEIAGVATVDFTADKVGTFEFKCSSCEDWRGMAGTLVVE